MEVLKNLLGESRFVSDKEKLVPYGSDYTEDLFFRPDAVAFPKTTIEVQAIVNYCYQHNIPITPRGAGTGLSGGSLPVKGGISICFEKMNKILSFDNDNFQITVEPGVINQEIRDFVESKGLFYPPDPASKGSSFIGGNIAHNSGGPRAVKYGVTRDWVLNLEVVLPNGEIIWTGSNTLKNSTGYNLTQLMIGSEGTLGIITKAVLKLISKPIQNLLLWCPFEKMEKACEAVPAIMSSGLVPSALEIMEKKGVDLSIAHTDASLSTEENHKAYLLIELDGSSQEKLMSQAEELFETLEPFEPGEVQLADSANQKENFWKIRRSIGEVVKRESIYKEEDTVVPRAKLPQLYNGVKEIGEKYGFDSICYGHAGDGNLHVNILKGNMINEHWQGKHLEKGIREIFQLCKSLGGTISGEHGIGYVQKKFMNEVFPEHHLQLFKSIKRVFDPKMLLNSNKIID